MKTVWVASRGEYGEGGNIISIHSEKASALAVALAQKDHFPGGWEPDGDDDVWRNGCDWVAVSQWEVKP